MITYFFVVDIFDAVGGMVLGTNERHEIRELITKKATVFNQTANLIHIFDENALTYLIASVGT